jgi:hypothetical protein
LLKYLLSLVTHARSHNCTPSIAVTHGKARTLSQSTAKLTKPQTTPPAALRVWAVPGLMSPHLALPAPAVAAVDPCGPHMQPATGGAGLSTVGCGVAQLQQQGAGAQGRTSGVPAGWQAGRHR